MSVADLQKQIEGLLFRAGQLQQQYEASSATLNAAVQRVRALRAMVLDAAANLPARGDDVTADAEFEAAREVAQAETLYWLGVFRRTSPLMRKTRDELDSVVAASNLVQDELRPHLEQLQREARKGALGNPPGASPSIDTRS